MCEREQDILNNRPIGVFDSGVGGLTVAREIMRQLPNERIVYFGDTARVPYGNKSRETIIKFSEQIVRFLQTQQVKAIVVACNSAIRSEGGDQGNPEWEDRCYCYGGDDRQRYL